MPGPRDWLARFRDWWAELPDRDPHGRSRWIFIAACFAVLVALVILGLLAGARLPASARVKPCLVGTMRHGAA